MSKKVDMNVFLHSLLVIKQMNDFTVSEAKDALLREHAEFTDAKEARLFIYRQLCRNIEKGLLKRTDRFDEGTKKTIYSKTEKFLVSKITPIKRGPKKKKVATRKTPPKKIESVSYQTELKQELAAYEIDLTASLEEAKEYQRLSTRFPELKEKLQQHQLQTKNHSLQLLGKVHALQKLLGHRITGYQSC